MEQQYLYSLTIILIGSSLVVFTLHKLKLPSLLGFIIAGGLIGPQGLGLITDTHLVEVLAEIGVVLLLFVIGIEFSITKLLSIRKAVIGGGGIQVLLTTLVTASIVYALSGRAALAVMSGFLASLSSTAIVLNMLSARGETDSPHGKAMLGILIFQDICVVPMMLLIPVLSGQQADAAGIALKLGEAVFFVVLVFFSARWLVPYILHQIVRTRNRELFITAVIVICLGTALITASLGLSLALGSFLAGLIISESEYSHQATADILPFKESFMGLFFVSIGMLLNAGAVAENLGSIMGLAAAIICVKVVTGVLASLPAGASLKTALQSGLGLAQVGEFSFVLAVAARAAGIIDNAFYQIFLSSSILTMIATPFMIQYSSGLSGWITSLPLLKNIARHSGDDKVTVRKRRDHVIIVGFGLNGRNLAGVLRDVGIPFVAVEMNGDAVDEMKKKNVPISYGDAGNVEILKRLGIEHARMLVVAISDPASTRRIVSVAHSANSRIRIVVRTRYVSEVDDLHALGASEVIPEEFETSVEIFSRVLEGYDYPDNVIANMAQRVRRENYKALRTVQIARRHIFERSELLPELPVRAIKVPENSHLAGKSIEMLAIRKNAGGTVVSVRRGGETLVSPEPGFVFEAGDVIFFTGDKESMERTAAYFRGTA